MQNFKKAILNILKGKSTKKHSFYFIGIGGISMYSLCLKLIELGQYVGGSDAKRTKNTRILEKCGVKIHYEHNEENVSGFDFVIYSFAVRDNVEVKKAKELNIPVLSRAEFLGLLLCCYKKRICVAGAHGKTTTTALIYHILNKANLNPSLHLGGYIENENISYKYTKSRIIVCEACEYYDAFLKLKPNIAVVLNTAPEHLDYFQTYTNVKKSFNRFAKASEVLICANEHNYIKSSKKNIYFGNNGDYYAKNIKMCCDGTYKFDCYCYKKYYGRFHINLMGLHNVSNALAAISVANELFIGKQIVKDALNDFSGVKRRFEIISKAPFIIHDYAHHPDEIKSVLSEFKKFYNGKLLVVFQPHTYSRTKTLMNEFVNVLKDYECLI